MILKTFSKTILFTILFDILFLSCTNNNNIKEDIKTIMGRELIYPSGFAPNRQYLVISYVDSDGCTSCKLRVHQWVSFIEDFKKAGIDIGIVFISHPYIYSDICKIIGNVDNSNISVVNDCDENWIERNNLPKGEIFHTFLVDNKKRVMVVGNPTMNDEIKNNEKFNFK